MSVRLILCCCLDKCWEMFLFLTSWHTFIYQHAVWENHHKACLRVGKILKFGTVNSWNWNYLLFTGYTLNGNVFCLYYEISYFTKHFDCRKMYYFLLHQKIGNAWIDQFRFPFPVWSIVYNICNSISSKTAMIKIYFFVIKNTLEPK